MLFDATTTSCTTGFTTSDESRLDGTTLYADCTTGCASGCDAQAVTITTDAVCHAGTAKGYKVSASHIATAYYISAYSGSTASQANFLFQATVYVGSCYAVSQLSGFYGTVTSAGAASICTDSACTSCTAISTATVSTPTQATGHTSTGNPYYTVSTTAGSYTAPTFYIQSYSSSTCDDTDFLSEDDFTFAGGCTVEADASTKYGKVSWSASGLVADYGCGSSCSSCDSPSTIVLEADCVAGTTDYYKLSKSKSGYDSSSDSSSTLSFMIVAFCALFALLF